MKALVIGRAKWLSGTCLMTCLFFLGINIARAETVINSGTTFTINLGVTVVEYGNLDNQNTTTSNLGPGTFEFSGTTAQTISGPNLFTNLTINNTAGVSLTGLKDNQVNGYLTLTKGLLTLGSLNLLLGPSASVVGTPSSSAMVVVTGTGELRKEFSGLSSFTYPVGDAFGTAEYSPVTANFFGGTFSSGNYLGVNLRNERDPAIGTANYLLRYWTLNSNNISNVNCQLTFNFLLADVIGTIGDLYCLKTVPAPLVAYNKYVSGYQLTGSVTSFSRFTGANIIDVTPNITAEPSIMHGIQNFNIIVQVTELNFGSTNGLITVLIPKDTRWGLTYLPLAEMIGTTPVNNSAWSYNSTDASFHIFTSTSVINKGANSKFGFTALWNAGATTGSANITAQITSWSGGEYRIDNNVDAEKLDYFY